MRKRKISRSTLSQFNANFRLVWSLFSLAFSFTAWFMVAMWSSRYTPVNSPFHLSESLIAIALLPSIYRMLVVISWRKKVNKALTVRLKRGKKCCPMIIMEVEWMKILVQPASPTLTRSLFSYLPELSRLNRRQMKQKPFNQSTEHNVYNMIQNRFLSI